MRLRSVAWPVFLFFLGSSLVVAVCCILLIESSPLLTSSPLATESMPYTLMAASFFTRLRRKGSTIPEDVRERVEERISQLTNYGQSEPAETVSPANDTSETAVDQAHLDTTTAIPQSDLRGLVDSLSSLVTAVDLADAEALRETREIAEQGKQLVNELGELLVTTNEKLKELGGLLDHIIAAVSDTEQEFNEEGQNQFRPYLIANK